jgi:hypothetical protein
MLVASTTFGGDGAEERGGSEDKNEQRHPAQLFETLTEVQGGLVFGSIEGIESGVGSVIHRRRR